MPEHLSDPNYEDTDEGADSRIMRNTLLVLVGPWLVIGLLYVGYLAATGGL